jgi:hypothetical protein
VCSSSSSLTNLPQASFPSSSSNASLKKRGEPKRKETEEVWHSIERVDDTPKSVKIGKLAARCLQSKLLLEEAEEPTEEEEEEEQ